MDVVVLNASGTGLGLRTKSALVLGTTVSVSLKNSVVEGWICHCQPSETGGYDLGLLVK